MSRELFLGRLRTGLAGLPPETIEEYVADYAAHFDEGVAAGRSEADVAAGLGDPARLARELKAEVGLKRWEAERNPSAAATAIFGLLGLGAIDVLILLPILLPILGVLLGFAITSVVGFGAGAFVFVSGAFFGAVREIAAVMLAGLGVMAGSVSVGALTALVTVALVNALVWYGRLHLKLLKPALEAGEVRP
ncbi:MAG: hypothetical protein RL588_542 [Pseudomonadota bacterium]|jgi:uncharacterized membrane protein